MRIITVRRSPYVVIEMELLPVPALSNAQKRLASSVHTFLRTDADRYRQPDALAYQRAGNDDPVSVEHSVLLLACHWASQEWAMKSMAQCSKLHNQPDSPYNP